MSSKHNESRSAGTPGSQYPVMGKSASQSNTADPAASYLSVRLDEAYEFMMRACPDSHRSNTENRHAHVRQRHGHVCP
ncbi:MAG: hypothetical protein NT118_15800 [Lentisphaerae bacterium]|nr:hypothetical protein [Lentisphaerota bacterium]